MKIVLLFLLINTVFADYGFGSSYLKDSKLCHPWNCINKKLGLEDAFPTKEKYAETLRNHLPEGAWIDVVDTVLNVCYGKDKPRRYTNTCPGQAMLHCVIDNFISHCPEENLRKDDACAPLSSLAGFKYMFSQSRYDNLEVNLPRERRPEWFLKNYFSTKCCDIPALFNTTELSECGFNSIIHYYGHEPKKSTTPSKTSIVNLMFESTQGQHNEDKNTVKVVDEINSEVQDPLDCCDMSDFIPPAARSDCHFHLTWSDQDRLGIVEDSSVVTTMDQPKEVQLKYHDVKFVPLSCEQETCIFEQLGVISEDGTVNKIAYSKLLDEFVDKHPTWRSAKARVVTRCLTKPLMAYEADCEINKVLACTFDGLTENCPHTKKTVDLCKHISALKNDTICLINSSKYYKNRRHYCDFPQFVPHKALTQCRVSSINRIESALVNVPTKRKHGWMSYKSLCKDTTPSANCLMSKMGILNKYNFMDYFKMKTKLKDFTSTHVEWFALTDIYTSTMLGMPMYQQHCASQRKLLNIIDSMLMTCPVSKRRNTVTCDKLFASMIKKEPSGIQPNVQEKHYQLFSSIEHNFMTRSPNANHLEKEPSSTKLKAIMFPKKRESIFYHPYFRERNIPKILVMPIIPPAVMRSKAHEDTLVKRPLILSPQYMKYMTTSTTTSKPEKLLYSRPFNHDSLFRSGHTHASLLDKKIAKVHTSATLEKHNSEIKEHISPITLIGENTF